MTKRPVLNFIMFLILLLVSGGLIFNVINTPAREPDEEQPTNEKVSSVLNLKQIEIEPSPMAANLLPAGLPNITRSPLKAKYACQIRIDGEALDIKSLKWVDDAGKVVYTGSDYALWDISAINKNRYSLRIDHVSLTTNPQLADWLSSVSDRTIEKKNIELIILDSNNIIKAHWKLYYTWPIKWTGPDLKATGNAVAIESIELGHEGIDRIDEDDDD